MRSLFGSVLLTTVMVLGCGGEEESFPGAFGGSGKGEGPVNLAARRPVNVVFVSTPLHPDPVLEDIWTSVQQGYSDNELWHLHRGVTSRDMVDRIIAQLDANNASIYSLTIFGHGDRRAEGGGGFYKAQQVGYDWIAPMYTGWLHQDHHRQLERLAPYFSPDSFVRLHGCSIAETPQTLAAWSKPLGGIPVWGGIYTQYGDRPVLFAFEGAVMMCTWMNEPACLQYAKDPLLP